MASRYPWQVISIREGAAGDVDAIERVRRESWRAAYADIIEARLIERATAVPSGVSSPSPWRRTLVAVAGEAPEVVGYAAYGPERTVPPPVPVPFSGAAGRAGRRPPRPLPPDPGLTEAGRAGETGEVYAIYLLPAWWSTGTGRSLMGAALAGLEDGGYRRTVLWVLAENSRARRFYERAGFSADGATNVLTRLGSVLEVRYTRPFSRPASS